MTAPSTVLDTRALQPDFVLQVNERIDELLDSAEAMAELRRLWRDWPVLIFCRQSLEEQEQVRCFGQQQLRHGWVGGDCHDIDPAYKTHINSFLVRASYTVRRVGVACRV